MEGDNQSSDSRTIIALRTDKEFNAPANTDGEYTTLPDYPNTSEPTDELCEDCSKIDLAKFFGRFGFCCRLHHYHLGKLEDIQSRNSCPLCRMISTVFSSTKAYLPKDFQRRPLSCILMCTEDNDSIGINFIQSTLGQARIINAIHVIRQCIEDSISGQELSNIDPGSNRATSGCQFGRLMDSRQVDFNLIRKWIRHCETTHGDTCSRSSLKSNRPVKIRLIDVSNRQIIDATTNERYLALSYVWGAGTLFCLNKQNLEDWQKPHSLTDDEMPNTILDAVNLVSRIGERYLWIDRVCIVMDDELDKKIHMQTMDQVYSSAILTIISADASCSDDCIPGVEPHTRQSFQQSEIINGVRYVTTQSELHSTVRRMNWSNRGWTFQEGFLSLRCLVFTPYQTSFQCKSEVRCEDSYWMGTKQTEGEAAIGNSLCGLSNRSIMSPLFSPPIAGAKLHPCRFHQYTNAVEDFSRRHFTREEDVLWAFTGVIKAFQSRFSDGFAWGLPVERLGEGLLWQPAKYDHGPRNVLHMEREGLPEGILQSNMIALPFPSWSWTSWCGSVRYNGDYCWSSEKWVEFVEWHQPTYYIVNTTKLFDERWREISSYETSKARPNHEHQQLLPPYAIMNERALGFLRFTTASVELDVEFDDSLNRVLCSHCDTHFTHDTENVQCNIRTSTEKTVGSIWIARSWLGGLGCKTGEFILLSEHIQLTDDERDRLMLESYSESKDPECRTISKAKHIKDYERQRKYNIMLIDWKERPHCAMATRIGLTQIDKNDWTELESSSKEIVLG